MSEARKFSGRASSSNTKFRPYDRFLCSQSLHGILRNQDKVSQAYETSVSRERLHTKRTTLHFVVRNEQRFPSLLGTNDAFRIFILLSETKSALVIKIYQLHCLFQRFPLLLGTKNALRIFIVLSVTKSALVIKKFSTLLPIYSLKF